jgi:hypothetical protein
MPSFPAAPACLPAPASPLRPCCCSPPWPGVVCTDGRVTALNLSNWGIGVCVRQCALHSSPVPAAPPGDPAAPLHAHPAPGITAAGQLPATTCTQRITCCMRPWQLPLVTRLLDCCRQQPEPGQRPLHALAAASPHQPGRVGQPLCGRPARLDQHLAHPAAPEPRTQPVLGAPARTSRPADVRCGPLPHAPLGAFNDLVDVVVGARASAPAASAQASWRSFTLAPLRQ